MAQTIRVLLADDHPIFRQSVRRLLDSLPDVSVVGEAADGEATVRLAAELSPDVVIMDVWMPGLDGPACARKIRAGHAGGRGPRVLALSGHDDPGSTAGMIEAGAAGYVMKTADFEELAAAVRAVAAGGTCLAPELAARAAAAGGARAGGGGNGVGMGGAAAAGELSARERELLRLIAEGKATKEAAIALGVSVKTVETQRHRLMDKLRLESVAELTTYAVKAGIIALEG